MTDKQIVQLTDELVAELAVKFGVTPDAIRREYAEVQSLGAEGALAQMDQYVASVEADVNEVVDDVAARYLNRGDRTRAMANFYQEGWDGVPAEQVTEEAVADLFLKLSVAIYNLAEARKQIATLTDANHRRGAK